MGADTELAASFARSRLSELPREVLDSVTDRATDLRAEGGRILLSAGQQDQACYLVVGGLVRSYLVSPAGRQVTIRYSAQGALLGLATVFASEQVPVNLQTVTRSRVLSLHPVALREAARSDARVGYLLLRELGDRVVTYTNAVGEVAFSSVHERVLTHLLVLATLGPHESEPAVRISQQELADQVGTVREVVVRILRELRAAGLVRTERDRIVLLDAARWDGLPRSP